VLLARLLLQPQPSYTTHAALTALSLLLAPLAALAAPAAWPAAPAPALALALPLALAWRRVPDDAVSALLVALLSLLPWRPGALHDAQRTHALSLLLALLAAPSPALLLAPAAAHARLLSHPHAVPHASMLLFPALPPAFTRVASAAALPLLEDDSAHTRALATQTLHALWSRAQYVHYTSSLIHSCTSLTSPLPYSSSPLHAGLLVDAAWVPAPELDRWLDAAATAAQDAAQENRVWALR
jgi:hypothetical protein